MPTKVDQSTDLQALIAAIAASPIRVAAPQPRDFADWCRRQQGGVDTAILEWLRSQARRPVALS